MDMQNILKELRGKSGLSQLDVANALGINRSAVAQWETGRSLPAHENIPQLANLFGCSPEVFYDDEAEQNAALHIVPVESMVTVPLVTPERLSVGSFTDNELVGRTVKIPESVLRKHPFAQALVVEDDSMDRIIPKGYIIVFDPILEPVNGKVVIVETEDYQTHIRRWYKGQTTLLLSAESHARHDDIVITDDTPIHVLGTAVHVIAPEGIV